MIAVRRTQQDVLAEKDLRDLPSSPSQSSVVRQFYKHACQDCRAYLQLRSNAEWHAGFRPIPEAENGDKITGRQTRDLLGFESYLGEAAMFPFQPIDLSKLSYTTVFDALAPMLPGGTIALGWLHGHQSVWANLEDEKTLKIMVAVFAVYVVGLVMIYLTSFEMSAVAFAVLIRKPQSDEPWRNAEWRKLASAFLGELSPPIEEPQADSSSQIQGTNAETLSKNIKENFEKRMAPLNFQRQWQRWYEILKVRFEAPAGPQQAFANLYFSTLNSVGWAGVIAAYISFSHVGWLSWTACILTIVVSHVSFTFSFSRQQHPDPSGDQLAAEILRAVEANDVGKEKGE